MNKKQITGFEARPGLWRIKIDGKLHPSDFRDKKDIRQWYDNMVTHGLYKGYFLRFLDWGRKKNQRERSPRNSGIL